MTHKCKLIFSLKIKHFPIVDVALGFVLINAINILGLERGHFPHSLVKLQT